MIALNERVEKIQFEIKFVVKNTRNKIKYHIKTTLILQSNFCLCGIWY